MPDPRYAIYYAPRAESALWRFAASWLGRDAATGAPLPLLAMDGCPEVRRAAITASPARYGFHATLKPPFRLAEGRCEAELLHAVRLLAGEQNGFVLHGAGVSTRSGFIAVTMRGHSEPLNLLADSCVRALDWLRRPATAEDLERRQQDRLSARQVELLHRWGYPYVFDQWKFHMTLTSSLPDERERAVVQAFLQGQLDSLLASEPLAVDSLCVFIQADAAAGGPFHLLRRYAFATVAEAV